VLAGKRAHRFVTKFFVKRTARPRQDQNGLR
jgi:hypothetical protein